jgi:hypothetical protein
MVSAQLCKGLVYCRIFALESSLKKSKTDTIVYLHPDCLPRGEHTQVLKITVPYFTLYRTDWYAQQVQKNAQVYFHVQQ